MAHALDAEDRKLALLAWVPYAGVPIALARWSQRTSLARQHALISASLYVLSVVIFFPLVLWSFAFGGTPTTFLAIWIPWVGLCVVVTITGFVVALRATVGTDQTDPPS